MGRRPLRRVQGAWAVYHGSGSLRDLRGQVIPVGSVALISASSLELDQYEPAEGPTGEVYRDRRRYVVVDEAVVPRVARSVDVTAREAIAAIGEMDPSQVGAYVDGDERVTVQRAAEARQEE